VFEGDGECDSNDGDLLNTYGLDLNCIEYDFEGGDCYLLDRVNTLERKKSKITRIYQLSKNILN
jgi:hypothetical protein